VGTSWHRAILAAACWPGTPEAAVGSVDQVWTPTVWPGHECEP